MIEVHNNQKIYEYLFVFMDKLPETIIVSGAQNCQQTVIL